MDEVCRAPYGALAEECSRKVTHALYAAVENFIERLFLDICDIACTFTRQRQQVYVPFFSETQYQAQARTSSYSNLIPRPMSWERSTTAVGRPATPGARKRDFAAILDEGPNSSNSAVSSARKRTPIVTFQDQPRDVGVVRTLYGRCRTLCVESVRLFDRVLVALTTVLVLGHNYK